MRIRGYRGELTSSHLHTMSITRLFWGAGVESVVGPPRGIIQAYVRDLDLHLDRGHGLMFWGPNGSGKTYMACALAKEVRRTGASVYFVAAGDLVQATIERRDVADEDGEPVSERARSVDYLVIDDLGKEGQSEFAERCVETLIRHRVGSVLPTCLTTNMSPAVDGGLHSRYSISFVEVLKEAVVPVRIDGVNWRDDRRSSMSGSLGADHPG